MSRVTQAFPARAPPSTTSSVRSAVMSAQALSIDHCSQELQAALADVQRLETALVVAQTSVTFWRRRLRKATLADLVVEHGEIEEDVGRSGGPVPA